MYAFDGRPPEAKDGELAKRQAKRKEAEEKLKKAQQEGNTEDIEKYSGMLTKVSEGLRGRQSSVADDGRARRRSSL